MVIFISYSSKNRALVDQLAEHLSEMGYTVLYDQEILAGQAWWDKILEDIRACTVFIYALSPEYVDSYPCDLEYRYARELNRPMLPVMIRPVDFKQVPSHIALTHVLDYTNLNSRKSPMKLVRTLNELIRQPAPALPNPLPAPPPTPISVLNTGAKPAIATEDVRFTAFHPKEATVETWYTLLVYAHIESAVEKVRIVAAKFKEEMGNVPREAKASAPAKLTHGTEIAIVPTCDGVTFNPERVTFKWIEDIHRADFRFRASKDLSDSAANIVVAIYVGPLIIATIKGGLLFNAESASTSEPQPVQQMPMNAETTASMYQAEQIFPSYSHDDEEIVVACRNAYKAIGFEFLRDRDTLRPGQDWNAGLCQMIDKADIFQLFWSKHSSESKFVRQEWEYALQQQQGKGGDFICPVYWQQPMIDPPTELSSLHFVYVSLEKKPPSAWRLFVLLLLRFRPASRRCPQPDQSDY
jgi:hypothetical protein